VLTPDLLSRKASAIIAEETYSIMVSAASAWEIATQVRLGRLPGAEALEHIFLDVMDDAGYTLSSIDAPTALRAGRLTSDHRDPLDGMIAAQAIAHDIPVISADAKLDSFGIRRIW
jgi:PIN domain nuclease of toxin-antitoxin system